MRNSSRFDWTMRSVWNWVRVSLFANVDVQRIGLIGFAIFRDDLNANRLFRVPNRNASVNDMDENLIDANAEWVTGSGRIPQPLLRKYILYAR